ncbi:MAG: hypothetical protein R3F60_05140 [bacterium]
MVDSRQAVLRLEAELRALEAAAATAEERARRLTQRLRQAVGGRAEAEGPPRRAGPPSCPLQAALAAAHGAPDRRAAASSAAAARPGGS